MNRKKKIVRTVAAALSVALLAAFGGAGAVTVFDAADPAAGLFASAAAVENCPPIAENLELTTYKDTSVGGVFKATDPEGEAVTFQLVREPKRGSVQIDGENFIYTPAPGKKGTDSFSYVATDAAGKSSGEATVTVKISKCPTKVCYADMAGSSAAYAAAKLAAEDVYIGQQLAGQWFFNAEETISRGDFLAMCLAACNVETAQGVTRTGFADDVETAAWLKPYISTALTDGIVRGYRTETGSLVFNPAAPIRYAEAAVILNSVLELADVSAVQDESTPAWAVQAVANLDACDIAAFGVNEPLTRGQAAQMLVSAMALLDSRSGGWSLLNWAR